MRASFLKQNFLIYIRHHFSILGRLYIANISVRSYLQSRMHSWMTNFCIFDTVRNGCYLNNYFNLYSIMRPCQCILSVPFWYFQQIVSFYKQPTTNWLFEKHRQQPVHVKDMLSNSTLLFSLKNLMKVRK